MNNGGLPATEVAANPGSLVSEPHSVLCHVAGDFYLHKQVLLNGFDIIVNGEPLERSIEFFAKGSELGDDSIIYMGSTYDEAPQFFSISIENEGISSKWLFLPAGADELGLGEAESEELETFLQTRGYDCLATLVTRDGLHTYGHVKQLSALYSVLGSFAQQPTEEPSSSNEKRRYSKALKQIECQIDPLVRALAGRSAGAHFSAADYWDNGDSKGIDGIEFGRELAIKTNGRKSGLARMRVAAPQSADIMAHPSSYQMGAIDQYFLDAAATLVFDGRKIISCSQLLKLCGFSNPYAANMAKTREYALKACKKARFMPIFLDVTDSECKWRGDYQVSRSTITTTLAKWDIKETYVEGEEDAVKDFELLCSGAPEEVMPLAAISREWEMITRISIESEKFHTVKASISDKLAWRYIVKQVYASGISNTIRFDTMFRDLDLDNIDGEQRSMGPYDVKRRRDRVIAKIEKMLDEKCDPENKQRMFLSWEYTKDKKTGEVAGVKIVPLKNTPALSEKPGKTGSKKRPRAK